MRILVVTTTLIALVFGGCIEAGGDPETEIPVADPDALAHIQHAEWHDCEQWHLHFDGRAEDFAAEAPPGYTVRADDAGLTTLLIHITLCPEVEEALLAVPVVAPPGHDDVNRTEIAVIQVFHSGHGDALYPEPFAPRLVTSTFTRADTALGPALTVIGGGETFTVRSTLNPSSGAFGAERWSRLAHDGNALGAVYADGNESQNLGYGPVAYTHEGPGGAPPATAGIAHHVTNLDIILHTETIA